MYRFNASSISIYTLVFAAEQAGFNLTSSETLKTSFLESRSTHADVTV